MITCIATLPLPSGNSSGGIPLHEPDPLHRELKEKYGIQIPVKSFGLSSRGKYYLNFSTTLQFRRTIRLPLSSLERIIVN